MRWLTWPTNTLCAWFAWRNYPPADGTNATVGNAVAHLQDVRRAKAQRRAEAVDAPAWWMVLAPWARIAQLATALTEQRLTTTRAGIEASAIHAEVAELRSSTSTLEADLDELRSAFPRQAEALRAEHAEELRRLAEQHADELAAVRAEAATTKLDDYRRKPPAATSGRTSKTPPKQRLSDEEAVQALLEHDGDPTRKWTQSDIVAAIGVGWGRAPRLLDALTEELQRRASEDASGDKAVNQ
jgi:hypothetical protein